MEVLTCGVKQAQRLGRASGRQAAVAFCNSEFLGDENERALIVGTEHELQDWRRSGRSGSGRLEVSVRKVLSSSLARLVNHVAAGRQKHAYERGGVGGRETVQNMLVRAEGVVFYSCSLYPERQFGKDQE